jgi:hypothetical protein
VLLWLDVFATPGALAGNGGDSAAAAGGGAAGAAGGGPEPERLLAESRNALRHAGAVLLACSRPPGPPGARPPPPLLLGRARCLWELATALRLHGPAGLALLDPLDGTEPEPELGGGAGEPRTARWAREAQAIQLLDAHVTHAAGGAGSRAVSARLGGAASGAGCGLWELRLRQVLLEDTDCAGVPLAPPPAAPGRPLTAPPGAPSVPGVAGAAATAAAGTAACDAVDHGSKLQRAEAALRLFWALRPCAYPELLDPLLRLGPQPAGPARRPNAAPGAAAPAGEAAGRPGAGCWRLHEARALLADALSAASAASARRSSGGGAAGEGAGGPAVVVVVGPEGAPAVAWPVLPSSAQPLAPRAPCLLKCRS